MQPCGPLNTVVPDQASRFALLTGLLFKRDARPKVSPTSLTIRNGRLHAACGLSSRQTIRCCCGLLSVC